MRFFRGKNILFFTLTAVILIIYSGCSELKTPTKPEITKTPGITRTPTITPTNPEGTDTPVITPTITFTPQDTTATSTVTITLSTPTFTATTTICAPSSISITAEAMKIIAYGTPQEVFIVMATDPSGNTLTNADVSISGPNGLICESPDGYATYTGASVYHYIEQAEYSVSVIYNSVNYSGSFTTENDHVISPDGSTISWDYPADVAMVMAYDPAFNMYTYGPPLTSPFDVDGTGLYTNGAGDYILYPVIEKLTPDFISGTDVYSTAISASAEMKTITK